jgi:hypothetical protein
MFLNNRIMIYPNLMEIVVKNSYLLTSSDFMTKLIHKKVWGLDD